MEFFKSRCEKNIFVSLLTFIALFLTTSISWSSTDLGNGFHDHGVVAPYSASRGIVATVDSQGKNIVLIWLMDIRGCYELLKIDALTGKTEEFAIPFSPDGDAPYASIMSSQNKFYTYFNSHFIEFDVSKQIFTFIRKTTPKSAMSMTEDDNGVIWSVTYPQSGIVSYNPKTGKFKDYGNVYEQSWSQYPRYIAADDKGWIYFALGKKASQIIAFDPSTARVLPVIPESDRKSGLAYVYRDLNGKVYGKPLENESDGWYELYEGKSTKIGSHTLINKKPYITRTQDLFHRSFSDGAIIKTLDLDSRQLVITKDGQQIRDLHFDYSSKGSKVFSMVAAPDGTICGGTFYPNYFFDYRPKTDYLLSHPCYGQWNTVVTQNDKVFIGGYSKGFLLEWTPSQTWVSTEKGKTGCNPVFRCEGTPEVYRPHKILAHMDGKTIVLAGTPDYGKTGGGLLLWDRETKKSQILTHNQIIPYLSTCSLVSLSPNNILGGTTTLPGTGGIKIASEAELYIMDINSKKILWHQAILPNVQTYTDLCVANNGLVYGIADAKTFFVFDTVKRKIVYQSNVEKIPYNQGYRVFISSPQNIYFPYTDCIAQIDSETYKITKLATSPVPITVGGEFIDGRIYFGSGSHLYSYIVAPPQPQNKKQAPTNLKLH